MGSDAEDEGVWIKHIDIVRMKDDLGSLKNKLKQTKGYSSSSVYILDFNLKKISLKYKYQENSLLL